METPKNKFFDSTQKFQKLKISDSSQNSKGILKSKISEIKKKTWPELFQKVLDGKKNSDVRLADFDIKEGDILVLEEYDPKTKEYTGRNIKKKIKNLNKLKLTEFNSFEDFKKYDHWLIEFE